MSLAQEHRLDHVPGAHPPAVRAIDKTPFPEDGEDAVGLGWALAHDLVIGFTLSGGTPMRTLRELLFREHRASYLIKRFDELDSRFKDETAPLNRR